MPGVTELREGIVRATPRPEVRKEALEGITRTVTKAPPPTDEEEAIWRHDPDGFAWEKEIADRLKRWWGEEKS